MHLYAHTAGNSRIKPPKGWTVAQSDDRGEVPEPEPMEANG